MLSKCQNSLMQKAQKAAATFASRADRRMQGRPVEKGWVVHFLGHQWDSDSMRSMALPTPIEIAEGATYSRRSGAKLSRRQLSRPADVNTLVNMSTRMNSASPVVWWAWKIAWTSSSLFQVYFKSQLIDIVPSCTVAPFFCFADILKNNVSYRKLNFPIPPIPWPTRMVMSLP